MLLCVRHSCGEVIKVPCLDELDAYANPAWCPTCRAKFFPHAPGPMSEEQGMRVKEKNARFKKVLQAVSQKLLGARK